MPAETASSIAPATRSGRPRVWYRRCLPTTVTRLPAPSRRGPLAAGSTRLDRKRRRRRPFRIQSVLACLPILKGGASTSPPNREFRPRDFRLFVPLRARHPTGPSVCPRHSVGAMTEIPPAEAERRPTKQVIVIRRDLRMRRGKEIAQGAHAATAWLADRVLQTILPNGDVDHVAL